MRKSFVATITELAAQDPRIILLTGDLGFMALEPFMEKFPDRFFNLGVAEQNMVGVATGLAESGFIPFVYSIVNFAALRPYEFIRNGPILHRLPVRVVGVGGGVEYGYAGSTHHGLEDIAVMRAQHNITVIAPADPAQTRSALQSTWDLPGPVYYRIRKNDREHVPGLDGRFELGRAQILGEGADLLLIAMGGITGEVVKAAETLASQGVECTIAIIASVHPSPDEDLAKLFERFPLALTIEAHSISGGVGSLAAEIIADRGLGSKIVRCGTRGYLDGISGSQTYLQDQYGISAEKIVENALKHL